MPAIGSGGRKAKGLVPLQPFMTVVEMEGNGSVGTRRDIASFGFEFEHEEKENGDDRTNVTVSVRDHKDKLEIRSKSVERFYATETCVKVWGTARSESKDRESAADQYVARVCDNGQFAVKDVNASDDDQRGHRDWFEITITGSEPPKHGLG